MKAFSSHNHYLVMHLMSLSLNGLSSIASDLIAVTLHSTNYCINKNLPFENFPNNQENLE